MNEADIRNLLHNLQVSVRGATYSGSKKRTRWLGISCPLAPWTHANKTDRNPSFGITITDDGRSHYKCFSCNQKGRLATLPTLLGNYRGRDYSKLRHAAEMNEIQAGMYKPTPKWDEALDFETDYDDAKHVDRPDHPDHCGYPWALGVPYLRDRGVSWLPSLKMGLRFDGYQRRILFPVWFPDDTFAGFTGRSIRKGNNETRGRDPKVKDYFGLPKREVLLGLRGLQPGKKIISEGLFDYAAGVQHGYPNARAILGTSVTEEKLEILIDEGEPVYFFMDNDLAGYQALFGVPDTEDGEWNISQAWAYRLYKEIPVWIVPYKNQLDGLDPGSIQDTKSYNKHIDKAWLFTGKRPLDILDEPTLQHPKSI